MLFSEIRSRQEEIRAIQVVVQQLVCRIDVIRLYLVRIRQLCRSTCIQGLEILQYKMEALDREDFGVLSIALEGTDPLPERSVELPSVDNNGNAGPSSLANVSIDPEFARLL